LWFDPSGALPTKRGQRLSLTAMKKFASSRSGARVKMKKSATSQTKALSAASLDEMHDSGKDLSAHLNLANAARPGREVQRVNVDFPIDLLRAIDCEAKRIGVTRQAFIKLRLATRSRVLTKQRDLEANFSSTRLVGSPQKP
jgi:hypothetical protein